MFSNMFCYLNNNILKIRLMLKEKFHFHIICYIYYGANVIIYILSKQQSGAAKLLQKYICRYRQEIPYF